MNTLNSVAVPIAKKNNSPVSGRSSAAMFRPIGSTEKDGGQIQERPVRPGDLAATIYRHFEVPLDSTYTDAANQPHNLLPHGGEPIRELTG